MCFVIDVPQISWMLAELGSAQRQLLSLRVHPEDR